MMPVCQQLVQYVQVLQDIIAQIVFSSRGQVNDAHNILQEVRMLGQLSKIGIEQLNSIGERESLRTRNGLDGAIGLESHVDNGLACLTTGPCEQKQISTSFAWLSKTKGFLRKKF